MISYCRLLVSRLSVILGVGQLLVACSLATGPVIKGVRETQFGQHASELFTISCEPGRREDLLPRDLTPEAANRLSELLRNILMDIEGGPRELVELGILEAAPQIPPAKAVLLGRGEIGLSADCGLNQVTVSQEVIRSIYASAVRHSVEEYKWNDNYAALLGDKYNQLSTVGKTPTGLLCLLYSAEGSRIWLSPAGRPMCVGCSDAELDQRIVDLVELKYLVQITVELQRRVRAGLAFALAHELYHLAHACESGEEADADVFAARVAGWRVYRDWEELKATGRSRVLDAVLIARGISAGAADAPPRDRLTGADMLGGWRTEHSRSTGIRLEAGADGPEAASAIFTIGSCGNDRNGGSPVGERVDRLSTVLALEALVAVARERAQ